MLELLKTLCMLDGVSGFEDQVRQFIREQARPYADSIREDAMGNLIVYKRGAKAAGNKLLLAAHMDEVGLLITEVTDEGYLRFRFVGGVDRRVAIGKPVLIGPEHIPGVIGMKAVHLVKAGERGERPQDRGAVHRHRGRLRPGGGGEGPTGELCRVRRGVRGVWSGLS